MTTRTQQIEKYLLEGKTPDEVEKLIVPPVTRAHILANYRYMVRKGLIKDIQPPKPKANISEALALLQAGMSMMAVHKQTGISNERLSALRKAHKIPYVTKNPLKKTFIKNLISQGVSPKTILQICEVSPAYLAQVVKEMSEPKPDISLSDLGL